ncbi:MAG: QacE family quaternary ammonium compound efflux SMR transporter [Rhodospirillales bacterium]|nr:MAG: QacE family quaternary ammonium compound efflux SMR transporter [Rhodospirillales bacterium]
MAWFLLACAIAFEVTGTVALKLSEGLSRLVPSLVMVPAYGVSFACLAFAVKTIPISVAYAIWAAVGTALIAAIGIAWFREPVTAAKLVFLGLIIVGVVGLHIASNASAPRLPD